MALRALAVAIDDTMEKVLWAGAMKDFAEATLQDLLNDFYDACTRCMFTVEPVDEERVSQAIVELYGGMSLPAPEIVFLESPWQVDKADSCICPKGLSINVKDFLWRQLQSAQSIIVDGVGSEKLAHCRAFLADGRLGQQSLPAERLQGLSRIADHLKSAVMAPVTPVESVALFRRLTLVMRRKFRALDGTPRYNRLPHDAERFHNHWPPLSDPVFAWDLIDQIAVTRFAVEYLGVKLSQSERDVLRPLFDLAAYGHAFWFTAQLAFCSERPEVLSVDSGERVHALINPALQYKDGMTRFAWHGVPVPEYAVAQHVHFSRIEREENAEVLRILIERYGEEKFLREIGARMVDCSEFGTLYRFFIARSRTELAILAVKNSTPESDGMFKTYYLHVPPDMASAKAAVAWTFGMLETEYEPLIQT